MDKKGSKGTILVIDDDVSMRLLLKKVLEQDGYEVFYAIDGEEGLEFIGDRDVDLILLDLVLSGIQGMNVLRELRRKRKEIPVIIITGFGNLELEKEASELGACGFINKPVSLDGMKALINQAVGEHKIKLGLGHGTVSKEYASKMSVL